MNYGSGEIFQKVIIHCKKRLGYISLRQVCMFKSYTVCDGVIGCSVDYRLTIIGYLTCS